MTHNKLNCPDGADFGSKKCKRGYGDANGGVWGSLRLARVRSHAVDLCWCACQESGFSRFEDVSILNYIKRYVINIVF